MPRSKSRARVKSKHRQHRGGTDEPYKTRKRSSSRRKKTTHASSKPKKRHGSKRR